jgi:putative hydrolase of HD superfamily
VSRHAQRVVLCDEPITVESWHASHIASVARWLHADAEWTWNGPYQRGPADDARTAIVHALYADPWQRDTLSDWPMRLALCVDGAAVGFLSWHWADVTSGWIRVGIVVYDPTTWAEGIGTRGLYLWVRWLASHPDAYRIDLATWAGNNRVVRAAHRIGMTDEVRLRGARLVQGQRYDSVVLGLVVPQAAFGSV